MRKLPLSLRIKLKKPLGPIGLPPKDVKVIAVGDITAYELLKRGYNVWVIIFDGREQRQPVSEEVKEKIEAWTKEQKVLEVENEPGTLSDEAMEKVKKVVEKGGGIKVKGEEDLLTIPCVLFAKEEWYVCYGQPNRGMVCIKVEERVKKEFENILKQMEGSS